MRFRIGNLNLTRTDFLIAIEYREGTPQREIISPLEVSLDYLLITPPSHHDHFKVRGLVVGLIGYGRESTNGIIALMKNLSIFIIS
jgi:hypothetical protein